MGRRPSRRWGACQRRAAAARRPTSYSYGKRLQVCACTERAEFRSFLALCGRALERRWMATMVPPTRCRRLRPRSRSRTRPLSGSHNTHPCTQPVSYLLASSWFWRFQALLRELLIPRCQQRGPADLPTHHPSSSYKDACAPALARSRHVIARTAGRAKVAVVQPHLTSKPSRRRHSLCARMRSLQASSPRSTTHASRGLRVSADRVVGVQCSSIPMQQEYRCCTYPAGSTRARDMASHARSSEAPRACSRAAAEIPL